MIKRDGLELINARNKNISIAKETLKILKDKSYTSLNGNVIDLSNELDFSIKNSVLYQSELPDEVIECISTTYEVTNETTFQAAKRLRNKDNLVALNFAAARNPGGGFLAGAVAQEEDLCRGSALYACIKNKPQFYNDNILSENTLYTDNIIYSPNVPVFRDDYNLLLDRPYSLSFISAPAPNMNIKKPEEIEPLVQDVLYSRIKKILQVAHKHGHKNIILGAWGCGAFANDPVMVAKSFKYMLENIIPAFEHVCFAVYDTHMPPVLYETFKRIIE